jgi:hypothetical protein
MVTVERSIPASRNHKPSDEKINKIGIPADKPRNNRVITRGCKNDLRDSPQLWLITTAIPYAFIEEWFLGVTAFP